MSRHAKLVASTVPATIGDEQESSLNAEINAVQVLPAGAPQAQAVQSRVSARSL
jgi:hypothetical protein